MKKLAVLVAGLALLVAPAASASRAPTAAEAKSIHDTVVGFYGYWWYYGKNSLADKMKVFGIKVSTVDTHWAMASLTGPKGVGRPALMDRVLLYHGVGRWIVADAPSSEFIGCKVAPPAVTRDLFRGLGGC